MFKNILSAVIYIGRYLSSLGRREKKKNFKEKKHKFDQSLGAGVKFWVDFLSICSICFYSLDLHEKNKNIKNIKKQHQYKKKNPRVKLITHSHFSDNNTVSICIKEILPFRISSNHNRSTSSGSW